MVILNVQELYLAPKIYQTHGGAALLKTVRSLEPTIIDKKMDLNFLITFICTKIYIISRKITLKKNK